MVRWRERLSGGARLSAAGDLDDKTATAAVRVFHPDAPAVALDYLPAEVEAEAEACSASALRYLVELLKDPIALGALQANAMVAHGQTQPLLVSGKLHFDLSALGTVFDGVVEQVGQHLLKTKGI